MCLCVLCVIFPLCYFLHFLLYLSQDHKESWFIVSVSGSTPAARIRLTRALNPPPAINKTLSLTEVQDWQPKSHSQPIHIGLRFTCSLNASYSISTLLMVGTISLSPAHNSWWLPGFHQTEPATIHTETLASI